MNEFTAILIAIAGIFFSIVVAIAVVKAAGAYRYGRQGGYRHAQYRHRYTYLAYRLGRKAYRKKWAKKCSN